MAAARLVAGTAAAGSEAEVAAAVVPLAEPGASMAGVTTVTTVGQ